MSRRHQARFRGKHVGFVFQQSHLIDERSVVSNVELGIVDTMISVSSRREAAIEALRLVELDSLAQRRAGDLSGGERHRVAIARALVKAPTVDIAEEPTAALDQSTGSAILEMLHRVARHSGAVLLTVTHDPRVKDHAERDVTMLDGRFVTARPQRHVRHGPGPAGSFRCRVVTRTAPCPHAWHDCRDRAWRSQRSRLDGHRRYTEADVDVLFDLQRSSRVVVQAEVTPQAASPSLGSSCRVNSSPFRGGRAVMGS